MHVALITVRADGPAHDRFANRAAGFTIVLAAQSKFALTYVLFHLREEGCQLVTRDIPQAKLAHARRIEKSAAKIQLEHFIMSCGVTSLAELAVADRFDAQAKPGLNRIEQRRFANARLSNQHRHFPLQQGPEF